MKERKFQYCQYKPCGKPLSGYSNQKYCSKNCRTYSSHGNTFTPGIRAVIKAQNLIDKAPSCKIWVRLCPIKKILFTARSYRTLFHPACTWKDKYRHTNPPIDKVTHPCTRCSNLYTKYVSRDNGMCQSCTELISGYNHKKRRRSIERKGDSINPYAVLVQYAYTCAHCAIHTPKELRGTTHPQAPEIDHIIPLSKGGTHTHANIQLLCRQCNINKGAELKVPALIKKINQSTWEGSVKVHY